MLGNSHAINFNFSGLDWANLAQLPMEVLNKTNSSTVYPASNLDIGKNTFRTLALCNLRKIVSHTSLLTPHKNIEKMAGIAAS